MTLFAGTVLVPCGLLIVFGYIMIRQERELALRHAEDQRQAEAYRLRQARLAELEKRKRDAAAKFFAGGKPAAVLAVLVTEQGFRAPWEPEGGPLPNLEACERAEFAAPQSEDATGCYRAALARETTPRARSYTSLLLARALMQRGEQRQAIRLNRELLNASLSLADAEAVPFAYYAADRLLRIPGEVAGVAARFAREPALTASPGAQYLLSAIALRLGDPAFNRAATQAIALGKHVASLRQDLPALLDALRRDGAEPVWLEHGDWMVGLAKAPESGKELLVAVASAGLTAPSVKASPVQASSLAGIYAASLILVLLLSASGAYLLWRDVRREVEVAELRSQFVSSVSHELKTPLTAIRMFAEMLHIRPDGPARTEYLQTIVQESERLSRLVDNVLDFSKIERGQKQYQLHPTTVASVLDLVTRSAEYPLRQAGFVLKVMAHEVLPLNGDNDALQQAVLNLIMNAMKYSGSRKEIEVEVRQEESSAVIAVRDFGIGVPVEYRQKIFERFYRVPSPENQRIPGAGLGLTLVAQVAKAHGGAVTVESAPGAGSVFALRLPMARAL